MLVTVEKDDTPKQKYNRKNETKVYQHDFCLMLTDQKLAKS